MCSIIKYCVPSTLPQKPPPLIRVALPGAQSSWLDAIGRSSVLIHVVENLMLYDEFYDPVIPDRNDHQARRLAQARTMLNKLVWGLGSVDGVEVQCEVVGGVPKSAIPAYARKHDVDLIVGVHGHGGVRGLLGSVANAVSHGATSDVMAVHL